MGARVSGSRDDLKARIDAIEGGYEFFLAYAAQGLTTDQGARSSGELRSFLKKMEAALDGLADVFRTVAKEDQAAPEGAWEALIRVLEADAGATLAAVRLVASRRGVSSQLIDNLNANIHLRALLTDLFVMDDLIDQG
jgi:hypothetical protein